jgi:23S rRNA pseudouridine2605 synthase
MELPKNKVHRIYRARVHGLITDSKLRAIRNGLEINGIRYKGMQVAIQRLTTKNNKTNTNSWLQITCQEGKNRQIRKIMQHLNRKFSLSKYW